jgi:hypothetical protein
MFHRLDPLICKIVGTQLEKPFTGAEAWAKGLLFDCKMCGRCVLSTTGMTCPANCPKSLRNGPCGGVRADSHCDVRPEMQCVWTEALTGARRLGDTETIFRPLSPREHNIEGTSAWLRLAAENVARRATTTPRQAVTRSKENAA